MSEFIASARFNGEAVLSLLAEVVLTGAGFYTVGAYFFLSRIEFHLAIWHVFVLAATSFMFVANWSYAM